MEQFIKGEFDAQDKLNKNFKEIETSLAEKAKQVAQLSNPNLLINSDFRIWQRGTGSFSSTGACVYTADRWFIAGDTNPTVSKTATGALITVTKVGTWTNFAQILTDDLVQYLVGKTVTITFKTNGATNGVNQLWCGGQYNGSNFYHKSYNAANITSDTFSMIIDINKATTRTEFGIQMKSDVAGRTVELQWVKLEIGNVATPFVPKLYVDELAACKRYYQLAQFPCSVIGTAATSNNLAVEMQFPVEMRTKPTVSISGNSLFCHQTCSTISFAISSYNVTTYSLQNIVATTSPLTPQYDYSGIFIMDAEIY